MKARDHGQARNGERLEVCNGKQGTWIDREFDVYRYDDSRQVSSAFPRDQELGCLPLPVEHRNEIRALSDVVMVDMRIPADLDASTCATEARLLAEFERHRGASYGRTKTHPVCDR